MKRFKVVELSRVTDDRIERELNEWSDEGYELRSIKFALQEGVRRPSMAFMIFERLDTDSEDT